MRVDKFLKNSRLIKRRTVAKSACEGDRIMVNGKEVKPGYQVKIGDVLTLRMGGREDVVEVLATPEHVTKDMAQEMYRVIDSRRIDSEEGNVQK